MKLKEFLIQSPTGKTHAINPKTNKTYCGYHPKGYDPLEVTPHVFEDSGWRFLDVLPDKKHEPTCTVCQRHYNDPLHETLTKISNDLKESIDEFLFLVTITKDTKGLGRFVELIAKFIREERKIRTVEKKGEK